MSVKKKVLTGVSYLAAASLAVGGTLALLQEETPTTTNVIMTDGNVDIVQIEQQRVDDNANQTKLQDFVQGKQMLPAIYTGISIPWALETDWVVPGEQAWKVVEDNENVVDKFVTVKNTGTIPAYVRTVFAFEGGAFADDTMLHVITNSTNVPDEIGAWEWVEGVTIDGRLYDIAVCTYQKPLQPNETTIPSLKQVYLDKAVTEEKAEELYGDSCDILVVSQACQTGGGTAKASLDEAFKPITATSHPWVDGVENTSGLIKNNEEFAVAVEAGDTTLMLDKGAFKLPTNLSGKKVTIYGTGEATVIDSTETLGLNEVDGADIAFVNVKIQGVNTDYVGYQHTSRVTYANCVIDSRITLYADDVVFTDCVFNGTGDYLWTYGADNVIFENCKFNNANSKGILVYQENDTEVCNVTLKNCSFTAEEKGYTGAGDWTAAVEIDSSLAPANVVIENCTADANYNGIVRHKAGSNATITVDGVVQ